MLCGGCILFRITLRKNDSNDVYNCFFIKEEEQTHNERRTNEANESLVEICNLNDQSSQVISHRHNIINSKVFQVYFHITCLESF